MEFVADSIGFDGVYLMIDGVIQSHLVPDDPTRLLLDYQHRMNTVISAAVTSGSAPRLLHLGAGALTLARAVRVGMPDSRHTVVEIQEGLVEFVLDRYPFPGGGPGPEVITADALDAVAALSVADGHRFDYVICDVYRGQSTPVHLTGSHFFSEVASRLTDDGIVLVNVVDEADVEATREAVAGLVGTGVFDADQVSVIGPAGLLAGRESGNSVVVASRLATLDDVVKQVLAAGPHPAASLSGRSFGDFG